MLSQLHTMVLRYVFPSNIIHVHVQVFISLHSIHIVVHTVRSPITN